MSINKVILVGHVGKEPETKALQSGESLTNFSLATSEKYKDKPSGQFREATEWHNITCFGKLSEVASLYVKKGSQVYIEGKIKTNKYTDKNNVEKFATNIVVSVLQLLGSKEVKEPPKDREEISNHASQSLGELDSDIPF